MATRVKGHHIPHPRGQEDSPPLDPSEAIPVREVIHTGPPAGHWKPAERALVGNPQRAYERPHGGRRLRWPNEGSCSSAGTRYRL